MMGNGAETNLCQQVFLKNNSKSIIFFGKYKKEMLIFWAPLRDDTYLRIKEIGTVLYTVRHFCDMCIKQPYWVCFFRRTGLTTLSCS